MLSLGNCGNGVWDSAEILHWAQMHLQDEVCPSFLTRHVSNLDREILFLHKSQKELTWFKKFILGEILENVFLGVSISACWADLT